MNSTIDLYLCKNYPFSDNSNVFDQAPDNHNIHNFVKHYYLNGGHLIQDVSDINLSQGVCRVPFTFPTTDNYNYMYIKTKDGEGNTKYYYCFINDILWENNLNTATIKFSLDVWNTYRNDLEFFQSYIEREHTYTDNLFEHLIDEGITPSDYYKNSSYSNQTIDLSSYSWVLALSDSSYITDMYPINETLDDYVNSPVILQCGANQYCPLLVTGDRDHLTRTINYYIDQGKEGAIIGVFLMPSYIVSTSGSGLFNLSCWGTTYGADDDHITPLTLFRFRGTTENPGKSAMGLPCPSKLQGYEPKNKKCLTYPFSFLQISNHLGHSLDLKFEKSSASGHYITLRYADEININGCCYVSPERYDGVTGINSDYTITSMNYPTVPFEVNTYNSYYGANQNTIANQSIYLSKDYEFEKGMIEQQYDATTMTGGANALYNLVNGGGLGTAFGYALSQTGTYGQREVSEQRLSYNTNKAIDSFNASLKDRALTPHKINGLCAPNNLLTMGTNNFTIKYLCPSLEEITSIDNYFQKYGYKVNKFDFPYLWNRPNFDFKKIPDVNITGTAPMNVINEIKGMFQRGVTIWHNLNNLFNYTTNPPHEQPPQPPT